MINMSKLKNILLTIACLFIFSIGASSQPKVKRDLENMVHSAVEKIHNGALDEAEAILSDVIAVDPACDAAWFYLGTAAVHRSDLDKARVCVTKAMELDPGNFWYRYKLAQLYVFDSLDVVVEMYEKMIEDFPKKTELYMEILDLYIAQKEYDKALKTVEEIENTIGPSEELAIYAYRVYYTVDRADEGLEYLRKYNSRYSSPAVLTILADSELSMYNDSLAIKYYDEAIELDSSYYHALIGRAEACRMYRRYDDFFPSLNRYIEAESAPAKEKTEYLSALIEKSDPQFVRRFIPQIDTVMQKLSQTHPGDSLVYNLEGMYYYATGRDDLAIDRFRSCAEDYPESLAAAASYVELLMYADRWQELSVEGRKAFERFPKELAFLEMAAIADFHTEDYQSVLAACDKLLKLIPKGDARAVRVLSTKGDVLHRIGENKKAYSAYEKALKIDPVNVYVLNNYAYYLSMEGAQLKKAYEMSRKTIEAEPDNATYLDTFGWILYLRGEYDQAKTHFKKAMVCGGKDSAVILDHYAEVLFALKDYNMAFVYWAMAIQKDEAGDVPGLKEKVEQRKKEAGR